MPPLPVIDKVHRVTLNITSATQPAVHNVFHVRTVTPFTAGEVADGVSSVLSSASVDNLLQGLPTSYSLTSIDVLPLDGTSATHNEPAGASWPAGLQTGDLVPEAAVIIKLATSVRGPRARGRVFVGPLTESVLSGGVPTASMVTTMVIAWVNLVNALPLATPASSMVIASYTHASAQNVTNVVGRPYIGTQRRRLIRLR